MNKLFKYLGGFILIILTTFFVVKKLKKSSIPQINLSAIALKDLEDKPINNAIFAGKPLVINFWGTWCGPCRQELPNFEKAQKLYGDKINIVLVSDESPDAILKFKADNNYPFFYAQSQQHFQELGLTSVPFTYFYDAKGNLVSKQKVTLSEEELEILIKNLIK